MCSQNTSKDNQEVVNMVTGVKTHDDILDNPFELIPSKLDKALAIILKKDYPIDHLHSQG